MATIPGVLVVEQDQEVRFQVQGLVRRAGFEVSGQAALGTEAVALAAELRPDVILCGLKQPVARALQTIEALVHVLPETPLIAYSEAAELAVVRKAMLAGARDFLHAPFRAEELKRSLAEALESEERRRLWDAAGPVLGPQGTVITVFGAKGGVGKTTVATNLGVALAQAGQAVVLVDADDGFGDAAEALALAKGWTVTDALRDPSRVERDGLKKLLGYHRSGLAVLPGPTNPLDWRGIGGEQVRALLTRLAPQFDVVLADTGSTLSEVHVAALESAAFVLWVTTPEYASVNDTLQALRAVRGLGLAEDRIGLLLNVASAEVEVRPRSIEQALGWRIFWTVPYDRSLRHSMQLGQPLVESRPRSPAAASLRELAQLLSGAAPVAPRDGLLRRLFGGRPIAAMQQEARS